MIAFGVVLVGGDLLAQTSSIVSCTWARNLLLETEAGINGFEIVLGSKAANAKRPVCAFMGFLFFGLKFGLRQTPRFVGEQS